MKIWAISLVLMILLTGCDASSEIERGMALRSALLQGKSCSFHGKITADYGEKQSVFAMQCDFDNQGNLTFTVTQPEMISEITGTVKNSQAALTFDDTLLYFELLTDDQLSPVSAPWIFMRTLRSGYLRAACMEGELLRLTIDDSYAEDALTLDVWLTSDNKPVSCEIVYDGRRILSLEITNFVIV